MIRGTVLVVIGLALATPALHGEDWPHWRGPDGRRISEGPALPTEWSKDSGIAWRSSLRGVGVSSPIVSRDLVILTSQLGRGPLRSGSHPTLVVGGDAPENEVSVGGERAPENDSTVTFLVSAFSRHDGSVVWEHEVDAEGALPDVHLKSNLANPSPTSDGARVYAWFATGQLVVLDMQGELVWERHLGRDYGPFEIVWGHASSPIIHEGLLILQCDHDTGSYLLALDRQTGDERWKVDRGAGRSFSTPVVVSGPSGDELIVNASQRLDAYDPSNGEWLWHAGEPNQFPVPVATYDERGTLYTSRGHRAGPYMAIRLGGRGDVSETHVAWRVPTGAPYISSIMYYDQLIYMANGSGIVTVVDADTGQRVWQDRLGGVYSASPVAGDGKVYFFGESGETLVLEAGSEQKVLARNDLGERVVSSPAVSDGWLFVRTDQSLIAVSGER